MPTLGRRGTGRECELPVRARELRRTPWGAFIRSSCKSDGFCTRLNLCTPRATGRNGFALVQAVFGPQARRTFATGCAPSVPHLFHRNRPKTRGFAPDRQQRRKVDPFVYRGGHYRVGAENLVSSRTGAGRGAGRHAFAAANFGVVVW
jgi:hypothetical protein